MGRRYAERVCLICGETIREGCYSGPDGNYRKHVAACVKKAAEKEKPK